MQDTKIVRLLRAKVVSNASDKTVVVQIEYKVKHPLIGKVVKKFKKYHAHDENNEYKVGQVVEIKSVPPISRRKSWLVVGRV